MINGIVASVPYSAEGGGCDEFFDDTYWMTEFPSTVTWEGTYWAYGTAASSANDLVPISSGANADWNVGYENNIIRITVLRNGTSGSTTGTIELYLQFDLSGQQSLSNVFSEDEEYTFEYTWDYGTDGDLTSFYVFADSNLWGTVPEDVRVTNIEFCTE